MRTMQDALTKIETSLEKLEKGGGAVSQTCKKRLRRLKTIVSLHEEKKDPLARIASMRTWVLEVEHIFDGSWAKQAEEISNAEVGKRFEAYLERLSCFIDAEERTEDEQLRLGHLWKRVNAFEARVHPMLRHRRVSLYQQ